ncbi:GMC oxidoreductase [Streptomyces griseoaurantiacus]|uniref:GMC oxidoreductase n=1 Tax=Streptomyces griseoaurantiacus TaxID=68213 RepID=UPI002ED0139C|nr:GMC oxidoreductase [Streptomyces jietaisiensis]
MASLIRISAAHSFDVVVIGSGPAGVAVAERLYAQRPDVTIAVLERGSALLRQHFYASGALISERDSFLARHRVRPWRGDLGEGGALLPALGGRGIVGGSQLHRFYSADLSLWPNGRWPLADGELDPYYGEAEARLLGDSRCGGPAQTYVCDLLAGLDARHPPCGPTVDAERRPGAGLSHRSSVQRLLALLDTDRAAQSRRLEVLPDTRAIRLVVDPARPRQIAEVRCVPAGRSREADADHPFAVRGSTFVLAASAVESARLVLASGLGSPDGTRGNVGRYLMEHIYCRGYLDVSRRREMSHGPVSVFVPPQSAAPESRFQVEICSATHPADGRPVLRVTGSAAMDPQRHNRVTLSLGDRDGHGVPRAMTVLRLSPGDERRKRALLRGLRDIAGLLGGRWATPPVVMPRGASYHEAGTLRIAHSPEEGAASPDGRLFGWDNLFTGDGSAFPSVGVANPILPLTAMGYRVADRIALSGGA